MVLLKDALMQAMPTASTFSFFSFLFGRAKILLPFYFFRAGEVRFLPLRVRALFLVFCPLTGSPLR